MTTAITTPADNASPTKQLLLVCRQPPYGNALAREAIDIALAAAVFDQAVTVVFIGDGVWQLHNRQNSALIGQKNQHKLLSALPLYGIDTLYVDAEALAERHIAESELAIDTCPLTTAELAALFERADTILNF